MRIYLHTLEDLADNIMLLNLTRKGRSFLVSKSWYRYCVFFGLVDKCDFNLVVGQDMFYPLNPVIYET